MITFQRGNIFDSPAVALVNTVNCVGIMGKGIAHQFARAYPGMHAAYMKDCKQGLVQLGEVRAYREGKKTVINFPTKGHWRAKSRLEDIKKGLFDLRRHLLAERVTSVAIPPLGCGNGGLEWADVRAIIESILDVPELASTTIYVFEPAGDFPSPVAKAPRLSLGHFILVALTDGLKVKKGLQLHKSAYWFNVYLGSPYFKFVHHKYGPYAPSLGPMTSAIRDYMDFCKIDNRTLLDDAVHRALAGREVDKLLAWTPHIASAVAICNRYADHVEVLATTHAVIREGGPLDRASVVERFFAWSEEKARFTPSHVDDALKLLSSESLIDLELQGYVTRTRWRDTAKQQSAKQQLGDCDPLRM